MNSNVPVPNHTLPDTPSRHGVLEAGVESLLREWLLLAASLTGTILALVLRDETGVWHRESSGLTPVQSAALEEALEGGATDTFRLVPPQGAELEVIQTCLLSDGNQRNLGCLCVLTPSGTTPSLDPREGFRRLAAQIQALLATGRPQPEARATPRAPSATSFVPGLVHELGSFIFGISANLDAFEARFAGMEDVGRYAAPIRRSLDRISAFLEELREFGDPQRYALAELHLDDLWRGILESLGPMARSAGVELRLELEGPLPAISADEPSLRAAFGHVIDFLVRQEEPGRTMVLHAGTCTQGSRGCIEGHLDASGLKLKNVDLARLFEPFYFRTSGLGRLALPVARRVFESHGGSLSAVPGPGGGMRIQFMLPGLPVQPPRPACRS